MMVNHKVRVYQHLNKKWDVNYDWNVKLLKCSCSHFELCGNMLSYNMYNETQAYGDNTTKFNLHEVDHRCKDP